jgi:hypothetical protein
MIDSLAEYLRSARTQTQAEVDAQTCKRARFDLSPAERMERITSRTFFGEAEH